MMDPLAVSLKSSAILLGALALAAAMRRSPASGRYTLWATALIGVLALPLLAGLLPELPVPLLPSAAVSSRALAPAGAIAPSLSRIPLTSTTEARRAGAATVRRAPGSPGIGVEAPDPASEAHTVEAIPTNHPVSHARPRAPTHADSSSRGQRIDAAVSSAKPGGHQFDAMGDSKSLLFLIWAVGVVALLSRLALGTWHVRRLVHRAEPAAKGLAASILSELSTRLGVARPVTLMISSGVDSPVTWGWLRPVILLPASATAWAPERLRVVLLHELIHVRRLHWPLQILAALASAIHWFNPLVWIAGCRMEVERELACDEGVLEQGTRASDYATHLVEIARSISSSRKAPASRLAVSLCFSRTPSPARSHPSFLERRLVMILEPRKQSTRSRWSTLALAGMAAAILPVAAIQLRAEPERPAEPAEAAEAAEPVAPPEAPRSAEVAPMVDLAPPVVPAVPAEPAHLLDLGELPEPAALPVEATPAVPALPAVPEAPRSSYLALSMSPAEPLSTSSRSESRVDDDGGVFEMSHSPDDSSLRTNVDGVDLHVHIEDPDTVEYSRDGREIVAMGRTAEVVIRTAFEGSYQRLEIARNGQGEIEYDWSVDGERRPFDEPAREWMGLTLQIAGNLSEASSLRGQHSSLRGQISSIMGHVSSLNGAISSVQGQRSALHGKISSIRGHVSALTGKISSIRGQESSFRGRISSLEGRISSLRSQKSRVSSTSTPERRAIVEELNADIDREISEIQEEIREVEEELRAFDGDRRVREVEQEIREFDAEARVAEVEAEIAALDVEGRVREIQREIREFDAEARVREVEAKIQKLQPMERADEIERRTEPLYPQLKAAIRSIR